MKNNGEKIQGEKQIEALAYMRTSSSTNSGADKDSGKRQHAAIEAYAKSANIKIKGWYHDEAVSGADPLEARQGFSDMLARIAGNGVRMIIVETASRFARDLIVQELGYKKLQDEGIQLIAADSPNAFLEDSPTAKLIRQVLGAVSEFEKSMIVTKLKGARERKKAETGKCGGRHSYAEMEQGAALIKAAKALNDGRSLRAISATLAEQGFVTRESKPYSASAVQKILGSEPLKSARVGKRPSHGKRTLTPGAA